MQSNGIGINHALQFEDKRLDIIFFLFAGDEMLPSTEDESWCMMDPSVQPGSRQQSTVLSCMHTGTSESWPTTTCRPSHCLLMKLLRSTGGTDQREK